MNDYRHVQYQADKTVPFQVIASVVTDVLKQDQMFIKVHAEFGLEGIIQNQKDLIVFQLAWNAGQSQLGSDSYASGKEALSEEKKK